MRMNVIEITGEPILHGGQEKFIFNVIENIDYSGLSIDVLTPYICDNEGFRKLLISKGGNVYELGLEFKPGKSRKLLLNPITQFLKEHHYDVVHIHSGSISVLAYTALAAKHASVRKIIVHSHSTGISSIKHKVIRFIFGLLLKKCATDFLACSKQAGKMKYPRSIVKNDLIIIENGISIDEYKRNDVIRKRKRNELNISDDSFVIGHVGRFSQEKNHSFIVSLFSEIHERIPKSKLLLVGDGELLTDVEEEVQKRHIEESVIFTGNVDNVPDYYQVMDIFVLPSLYEGFSFVTLEAQAAGLPCLISTGVPETVVLGQNVDQISLEDKNGWIERAIYYKDIEPVDNSTVIREKGYDIKQTAAKIKNLYEG